MISALLVSLFVSSAQAHCPYHGDVPFSHSVYTNEYGVFKSDDRPWHRVGDGGMNGYGVFRDGMGEGLGAGSRGLGTGFGANGLSDELQQFLDSIGDRTGVFRFGGREDGNDGEDDTGLGRFGFGLGFGGGSDEDPEDSEDSEDPEDRNSSRDARGDRNRRNGRDRGGRVSEENGGDDRGGGGRDGSGGSGRSGNGAFDPTGGSSNVLLRPFGLACESIFDQKDTGVFGLAPCTWYPSVWGPVGRE